MDKLTVRRKLLRGSLSAPVVLTVASPSNLAAASTTCLVNTPQTPLASPVFQPTTTPDVYFRVQTNLYDLTYPTANGPKTERFYKVGTTYYRIADGTQLSVPPTTTVDRGPFLALGYVDPKGTPLGYGWPSTSGGGQFTSIGCWNSLLI